MTHCNTLQHTATHCNTLQNTATHCNTCHSKYVGIFALGSVQTHHCCPARSDCDKLRNTMQHNETHSKTLQHMSQQVRGHFSASEQTRHCCPARSDCSKLRNTLQHTATHCNTLQHMSQQVCGQFLVHEGRQSIDTQRKADKARDYLQRASVAALFAFVCRVVVRIGCL